MDQLDDLEKHVNELVAKLSEIIQRLQKDIADAKKAVSFDQVKAIENDRKAVAREIHDSIGGSLTAIKLFMELRMDSANVSSCESAKPIEQIIDYLKDTIKETRTICHQLNSRALECVELAVAISKLIRRFNQFFPKIEVDIEIDVSDAVISAS